MRFRRSGSSLTAWQISNVRVSLHLLYVYCCVHAVNTYNIPRVTDCTRELNEWVYEGDQDRLINTPPRELPELVRRFTQDIYMCVYVQPDVAMYGDGGEEDHQPHSVREPYSIITECKCSIYAE